MYRQVARPDDLFRVQFSDIAHVVPSIKTAENWAALRMSVEKRLALAVHPGETTLAAIYKAIGSELYLDAQATDILMQSELACEKEHIRPYFELAALLQRLAAEGKCIIVTTDTYLPEAFILELLKEILPFDHMLICSSAINKTKREGSIYALVCERANTTKLIHIGDNRDVDMWQARKNGVKGYRTYWDRQKWLAQNTGYIRYLRDCACLRFLTPYDEGQSGDIIHAQSEIAWRWSIVLTDFMLSMRDYARTKNVDEVWFLSRDCEALFKAAESADNFFQDIGLRYVYASRASVRPIFAVKAPDLFQQSMGRSPTPEDCAKGRVASVYYEGLASGKKRILIVDMGGTGRLQAALQMALPEVEIFGYYFGLEPRAETTTKAKSSVFLNWNPTVFSLPPVEWLAGFTGASCDHFVLRDDSAVPVFRALDGDCSPEGYSACLQKYLAFNLAHSCHPVRLQNRLSHRSKAVRTMCLYPDVFVTRCFSEASIGSAPEGGDALDLRSGGQASLFNRVMGRDVAGNIWPSYAMWGVSDCSRGVLLLQWLLYARIQLKEFIKFVLLRVGCRRSS